MNRFFNFLVYLVFLTTPLESITLFRGFSIVKLFTIILLLATALKKWKEFIIRDSFLILSLIYTFLTIISYLWSIDKDATGRASLLMVLPSYIVTLIIFNSLNEKVQIERIFFAYVFGCAIAAVYAVYLFATGFRFIEDSRLTVLGQDQNELSFLLSFGIVSIIYLLKYTKPKAILKILLLVLAFLYAFIVLTTGSRTGFVMLLSIVSILVFTSFKRGKVIYIAPMILIVGFLLFKYVPTSTSSRLFETADQIRDLNLTGRVNIWEMGMSAFKKKDAYLLGTGFHTFSSLLEQEYGIPRNPHNTYLSTFIGLGVLGLLLFLGMIISLLRKVYYLCKYDSFFYILLILPMLIIMITIGTETRRWLLLIGVIIIKIWQFSKEAVPISPSLSNKT